MRTKVIVGAGAVLFGAALGALLLTGNTDIRTSADEQSPPVPLLTAVVLPLVVGLLLTRLAPPHLSAIEPAAAPDRPAIARQVRGLVGLAVAFALVAVPLRGSDWYVLVKVVLLLGGAWLVLRVWRAPAPGGAEHRRRVPTRWYWLGPLPVLLGWGYLTFFSPFTGEQDLSEYLELDRAYLIGAMVFTFLTASVLEEVFYRAILQTRLEALLGRWPAIVVTALLFAAMHSHRLDDGPLWTVTAIVVVFNGGFGLFVGYLWSKYRNLWAIVAAHTAINALALVLLLLR